jgi:DivIVA domain-containing protein
MRADQRRKARLCDDRGMRVEDVHEARFARSPFGRRGYDERSVDELLERIEAHLTDPAASELAAEDVRRAVLPRSAFGLRGYACADVDAFLDRVVREWPR